MAIVVSAAGKIGALDGLLDVIDSGTGDASGDWLLTTSADVALATLTFSATAFAGAANVTGTIKAASNAIGNSGTPVVGTIAKGVFRDKTNTAVISFGIAVSGSDMDMVNLSIIAGTDFVSSSGVEVSLNIT